MKKFYILFLFFSLCATRTYPQNFNIPPGAVIPGDTVCFPVTVSGIGLLYPPGWGWFSPFIDHVTINITTTHPQTLSISLVSPSGTTLLLSAFNGAGGSNYTNTEFSIAAWQNITSGTAPFTGQYYPQGPGGFSVFDYQNADGVWQLCIADTLTDTTGVPGIPGPYMNSFGGGTIAFGSSQGPPPCWAVMNAVWSQTINSCQGTTYDLNTIFPGVIFLPVVNWTSGGVPVSNPSAVPVPGVYDIFIDDGWGCWNSAQITINAVVPTSMGPDLTASTCNGVNVNISSMVTIPTGYNWDWYFNNSQSTAPYSVNTPGVYTVIAGQNLGGGCIDTVNITLSNNAGIAPLPDSTINVCSANPVDLTVIYNLSGLTAVWTSGGNPVPNPAAVTASGVYNLSVTDVNGCTDQAVVTLNTGAGPALGSDQTIDVCPGTPVDLNTLYNTAGLSVTWTQGGVPVINPSSISSGGTYDITVTDMGGCTDQAQVIININSAPALGSNQSSSICNGATFDLSNVFLTAGLTTAWTYNNVTVANPGAVTNTGTYQLVATNQDGCTDTALFTLSFTATPSLGADQSLSICSNTTMDLTGIYNTTGWQIAWSLNNSPVSNPAAVNTGGTYQLVAGSGCTDTALVILAVNSAPALGPDQSGTICQGSTVDLTAFFNTNGLTSAWTYNSTVISNPSAVSTTGTYQLVAVNTDGCSDTADYTLAFSATPTLGADQNVSACANTTVDLTALYNTSGFPVSWTLNNTTVSNPGAVNLSGTYQLIAGSGCNDTALVYVTMNAVPALGNDLTIVLCTGDSTNLTQLYNTTGLTAAWTSNGNAVANPASVNSAGIYLLDVTNADGCTDQAQVTVTQNPAVNLGADQTLQLCSWMSVDLNTLYNANGLSFSWTLNGLPVINTASVTDSGDYVLTATDANGCTDQATVFIDEIPCECVADFTATGECMEMPVVLNIQADSAIVSARWEFSHPEMPANYQINPSVGFVSDDSITVTLTVELTCGMDTIVHKVQVDDCTEACKLFLPSAFSPNKDGLNDNFHAFSECEPVEFELMVINRLGQIVFKTDNLHAAWDGISEEGEVPEGVYSYKVNYRLPYQKLYTDRGRVTLVR